MGARGVDKNKHNKKKARSAPSRDASGGCIAKLRQPLAQLPPPAPPVAAKRRSGHRLTSAGTRRSPSGTTCTPPGWTMCRRPCRGPGCQTVLRVGGCRKPSSNRRAMPGRTATAVGRPAGYTHSSLRFPPPPRVNVAESVGEAVGAMSFGHVPGARQRHNHRGWEVLRGASNVAPKEPSVPQIAVASSNT